MGELGREIDQRHVGPTAWQELDVATAMSATRLESWTLCRERTAHGQIWWGRAMTLEDMIAGPEASSMTEAVQALWAVVKERGWIG